MKPLIFLFTVLALMMMPAAPVGAQVIRLDSAFTIPSHTIANSASDTATLRLKYNGTAYKELVDQYPDSVHIAWYGYDSVKVFVKTQTAYAVGGSTASNYTTASALDTISVGDGATDVDYINVPASRLNSKDYLRVILAAASGGNQIITPNTLYVRFERYYHLTTPKRL